VNRIFVSLAVVANLALLVALGYGLSIGDPGPDMAPMRHAMSMHLLLALGASLMALLQHSAVLTYFMATGRWIEEASAAYQLGDSFRRDNIRLKYRVIPWMVGCVALVIITGAAGAMSDPMSRATSPVASTLHFTLALLAVAANLLVSWAEFRTIVRNSGVVAGAWREVQKIRAERGLS
jgi:hypothetical protein